MMSGSRAGGGIEGCELCFLFWLGEGEADELRGGEKFVELGQPEESTNWDSRRSGRIGRGRSGPIGTAGEVGPSIVLYYPGLVFGVFRKAG
jgi:hypothetical protein